jgi:hypothetical protein
MFKELEMSESPDFTELDFLVGFDEEKNLKREADTRDELLARTLNAPSRIKKT